MNQLKDNSAVFNTRDIFFDSLYEFAKKDKDLIFLTADMGAKSLEKFKVDFPKQYFNLGIAEQNTILIASGLALSGKKVFVYGITPFITERCFEQIKIDVAYMNLPITIIGIGTGFSYGVDGPTHYSISDVALLSTLKNMTILGTNDRFLTSAVAKMSYENDTPTYVRLEKEAFRDVHNNDDFSSGCSILKKGSVLIFSSGKTVYNVISVVDELEKDNISDFTIIDIFKLHPIDEQLINNLIKDYSKIVVVEEHIANGGIGNTLYNIISKQKNKQFLHLCVRNDWNSFYGDYNFMLERSGLDKNSLIQTIKDYVVR